MAWIYRRSRKSVGGGVGPVAGGQISPRHGCRGQAPRDGFTASPATGPTPPSHGNPAFALAVAVAVVVALASAGAGRRPAKALPPLPVQCRARFPTTVPRT
ncbi:hypothetical protein D7Y50_05375 [Stenotrophomonas maltophilia]|nr:hypothetical protein [Stenotrophomonas maltophilia]MBA0304986.1 hypothetical protein [Stenotrophomonas maltophilia]